MEKANKKISVMNKVIDTISGIFIPVINVLMAAGILKGILMLAVNTGVLVETGGVYQILHGAADGFFYFLPIYLAYTTAKMLKVDIFTAVMIATALLYPDITSFFAAGNTMDFMGIPIQPVTYESSVIPIILAVLLLYFVEKPMEKYIPATIKGFMKPLLSMIIVVPITFMVFGPMGTMIGDGLAKLYGILHDFSPIFTGVIFGLIWQPLVVFGFQWGMVPVIISNVNQFGMDQILPILGPAVFGQAGAALAVGLMTRNKKRKMVALSASVTAVLGVTEPALYSVTVPLKRPMIAACIAGAIGGGIVGGSGARAISFAFPSLISLVVYLGEGFWTFLIACILAFIISFILTYLLKFEDKAMELEDQEEEMNALIS